MGSFGESYMKRILIAGAVALAAAGGQVLAADLPPAAAPPPRAPAAYIPPPPLFSWTGIYLGINGGGSWGTATDQFNGGGVNSKWLLDRRHAGRQLSDRRLRDRPRGRWRLEQSDGKNISRALALVVRNQENLAGHRSWPRRLGLGPRFVLRNGRRRFRQRSSRAGSAALRQRNPDRLDSRRRRRMGLPAELDGEGRISLRRSRQPWLYRGRLRPSPLPPVPAP